MLTWILLLYSRSVRLQDKLSFNEDAKPFYKMASPCISHNGWRVLHFLASPVIIGVPSHSHVRCEPIGGFQFPITNGVWLHAFMAFGKIFTFCAYFQSCLFYPVVSCLSTRETNTSRRQMIFPSDFKCFQKSDFFFINLMRVTLSFLILLAVSWCLSFKK